MTESTVAGLSGMRGSWLISVFALGAYSCAGAVFVLVATGMPVIISLLVIYGVSTVSMLLMQQSSCGDYEIAHLPANAHHQRLGYSELLPTT